MAHDDDLSGAIAERLPEAKREALAALGALAEDRGVAAYLVGGVVRDLLLGVSVGDLDVAVEEPAEAFARAAADRLGGAVKAYTRFGTAILAVRGLGKIDIATARSETYERPGALPTVTPDRLAADLARRDFTINAMAVAIMPGRFGHLFDPHGGRRDLERGVVRVLHDGSFTDDPTRLLRAVRFAARLGFALDEETERLLREAAATDCLETVTGERIANEIVLILGETSPWAPVRTLADWGILESIAAGWTVPDSTESTFERIDRIFGEDPTAGELEGAERWIVRFLALVAPLEADVRDRILDRLKIAGRTRALADASSKLAEVLAPADADGAGPSDLRRILDRAAPETLVLAAAREPGSRIAERIVRYLTELRHVRSGITGHDVSALGVEEGESIGAVLDAVLDARLDGTVETREDELALAARLVRELDATNES